MATISLVLLATAFFPVRRNSEIFSVWNQLFKDPEPCNRRTAWYVGIRRKIMPPFIEAMRPGRPGLSTSCVIRLPQNSCDANFRKTPHFASQNPDLPRHSKETEGLN
jgi:hypothetical protein